MIIAPNWMVVISTNHCRVVHFEDYTTMTPYLAIWTTCTFKEFGMDCRIQSKSELWSFPGGRHSALVSWTDLKRVSIRCPLRRKLLISPSAALNNSDNWMQMESCSWWVGDLDSIKCHFQEKWRPMTLHFLCKFLLLSPNNTFLISPLVNFFCFFCMLCNTQADSQSAPRRDSFINLTFS